MNGCPFLVEDCTMDGTDYDCEHPTYGVKYGCDHCPMFGRNSGKRQYRLVNPRVTPPNKACTRRAKTWRKKVNPNQKVL